MGGSPERGLGVDIKSIVSHAVMPGKELPLSPENPSRQASTAESLTTLRRWAGGRASPPANGLPPGLREPAWTFAERAARTCGRRRGPWPRQDIDRRPGHSQVRTGWLRPLRGNSVPRVTTTSSFRYRVGRHPPASPSPLTAVCAIRTARRVTTRSPSSSLYPKCHHQFTDIGQNLHGTGHPAGAA